LPGFVAPMQAMRVDSIRPGNWIYEIKFDGYRALAVRGGNETRARFEAGFQTKTGHMERKLRETPR
jgi:hypothetical protein